VLSATSLAGSYIIFTFNSCLFSTLNRSFSPISALLSLRAFASAGMRLPSRCLTINYSLFQAWCHNMKRKRGCRIVAVKITTLSFCRIAMLGCNCGFEGRWGMGVIENVTWNLFACWQIFEMERNFGGYVRNFHRLCKQKFCTRQITSCHLS
jgi:hypothetical protein